jgi:hypothetical protein
MSYRHDSAHLWPVYDPSSRTRYNNNNNSVASVRKRTIPTERPPLVSEVSAQKNTVIFENTITVSYTIVYHNCTPQPQTSRSCLKLLLCGVRATIYARLWMVCAFIGTLCKYTAWVMSSLRRCSRCGGGIPVGCGGSGRLVIEVA